MTGLVVVDASLAFKRIVSEPYSDAATTKLEEWVGSRTRLLAPGLMALKWPTRFTSVSSAPN